MQSTVSEHSFNCFIKKLGHFILAALCINTNLKVDGAKHHAIIEKVIVIRAFALYFLIKRILDIHR